MTQIEVKSAASIETLQDETKNAREIAPKDIEIVVSKMRGDDVTKVFNNNTVSDKHIRRHDLFRKIFITVYLFKAHVEAIVFPFGLILTWFDNDSTNFIE